MPSGEAGLFVDYCAKDFLDATYQLDPWEELAYRRICDLIYTTNDRVLDDDRMLAWATKTGSRWRAVKAKLTGGDRPKLVVVDGRITNHRCQAELRRAEQKIEQQRQAGVASAAAGKSLKNLRQHRTGVRSPVPNGAPNGPPNHPGNQVPIEDSSNLKGEELGRDAPSGGPAPPDPEPVAEIESGIETPAPEMSAEEREEVYAGLGDLVARLRGQRPRHHGIHDPVAYAQAIEDAKWGNWLKGLHGFASERFDGDHRWQAWEIIDCAQKAGSREATPRHVRKQLDAIDKLRHVETRAAA